MIGLSYIFVTRVLIVIYCLKGPEVDKTASCSSMLIIVPQLLHIGLFLPYLGVVSLYKLGCILHGVGIKSMASGYVCVLC